MFTVGHFPPGGSAVYWLGVEAAGNYTFYGVDGTYIGKGLPSNTNPYAHWAIKFQDNYNPSTNVSCIVAHTAGMYTSYTGELGWGKGWGWGCRHRPCWQWPGRRCGGRLHSAAAQHWQRCTGAYSGGRYQQQLGPAVALCATHHTMCPRTAPHTATVNSTTRHAGIWARSKMPRSG
jgi:hypothetical protein